jgi:transcriptional regulator with XRE-family HTH domain
MNGKSGNHAVFAANLKRLCESETSIADVCRDTGINRQQFNKYLAGRAIPSAMVMRKICQRLGVSQDDLLTHPFGSSSAPGGGVSLPNASRAGQLGKELDRLFALFVPDLRSVARLENSDFGPGAYHAYFPFADFTNILLRAYLEVWWHKDALMFTRLTRIHDANQPDLSVHSRHYGVAVAAKGEISMIGRNRHTPYQVSLLNIQPAAVLKRHFIGLTLTHGAGPPLACRVVLDRLDNVEDRRANLRPCGVVAIHDQSVPRFVQQAMRPDALRGPTLQLPDIDQIIGGAMLKPR